MRHFTCSILLPLLLLTSQANAESSFFVSPSIGNASIQNIKGYGEATFLRVDGRYHPIPEVGVGIFAALYDGFRSNSEGNPVDISLNGYGVGVTGKWPVHPHVQPYVRLDYMIWNAESTGLYRTLGKDKGGSPGIALGIQVPIKKIFGVRAEVSNYNNVSGANIRQFLVGLTLEF